MIDIYSREYQAAMTIIRSYGVFDLSPSQQDDILADLESGIDYQQVAIDFLEGLDLNPPNEARVQY